MKLIELILIILIVLLYAVLLSVRINIKPRKGGNKVVYRAKSQNGKFIIESYCLKTKKTTLTIIDRKYLNRNKL